MNQRHIRRTFSAGRVFAAAWFVIFIASTGSAVAKGPAAQPRITPAEVQRGELLFRGEEAGDYFAAPLLKTEVVMTVSGMVNRATVRQRFVNPEDRWLEGVYVFPLPETAAVDHLRMQVGDRFITGVIREREEARREYEAAKAEGKTASLLEQERPNIFTSSVANIGPHEEIVIEIEYQETLVYDSGSFSLRFPMVVGPRYIPGNVQVAGFGGSGWAANTAQVPDASRITPPVLHPALGKINPVSIAIEIDAGFPLAEIASASHGIVRRTLDGDRVAVTLDDGDVPADRDFELSWTPAVGTAPGAGLFVEQKPDGTYLLMMIMPPTEPLPDHRPPPREVIFVIDTSGSMGGTSIVQARAALQLALDRLRPEDRFNVIQFDNHTSSLFAGPMDATPALVARAKGYVAGLTADGGTEMLGAMKAALDNSSGDGRVRQVIFLTDGSIGNESQLFDAIKQRLGDRRLFTVGIGSAPNSYFMRKAAEYGRGTFTYIDDLDEVAEEMAALFVKLEQPVVTDMAVAWPDGVSAEMMPRTIPDLYQGEPIVLSAKVDQLRDEIGLRGRRGSDDWILTVPLANGANHPGVATLWARAKIAALNGSLHEEGQPEAVRKAVVEVALAHHLVSAHTSLVAVDITPRRPEGEVLDSQAMATNLPAGWDFDSVFGSLEQRDRGGMPALRKASLNAPNPVQLAAVALPQGATDADLRLLFGALLMLLSLILVWRARRFA